MQSVRRCGRPLARRGFSSQPAAWLTELTPQLQPAGWAALVARLGLQCPRPFSPLATLRAGPGGVFAPPAGWRILAPPAEPAADGPAADIEGDLALAMRHEGPNLTVLAAAMARTGHRELVAKAVVRLVRQDPTAEWARRLWFLYEWLAGEPLGDLPNAPAALPLADVLDSAEFYTALPVPSERHRVRDNLLGGREFCPTVRRTPELEAFANKNFGRRAAQLLTQYGSILTRDYSYNMVMQETVHSMVIENVAYSDYDVPRLASTLMRHSNFDAMPLDEATVKHYLLPAVMGHANIPAPHVAYRQEQSYVSETQCTVDDTKDSVLYIPPRPEDVPSLMRGLFHSLRRALNDRAVQPEAVDSVVQAACLGFGLVYIQPFKDGNGRLHRLLIQQLLGRLGFVPKMIFPVSRIMVRERESYQQALRKFDDSCRASILYRLRPDGSLEVVNATAHLYRYLDATPVAEYLYHCVQHCVETDLPSYCNVVSQSYYRAYE